ncbi:MAG: hypothetical protein QXI33_00365 [Candidatus Pacearchaeota archaeon]
MLEDKTLIIGFDDLNHAGDRKGDIIVASFSFNVSDSKIQKFKNRKDMDQLLRWFHECHDNDYRFATLFDRNLRNMQPNLQLVAPYLIQDFLDSCQEKIGGIKCYFDGIIRPWHKEFLMDCFSTIFKLFSVDHFIKKGNVHYCLKIIYISHILAHDLYTKPFHEIMEHKKRVEIINEDNILALYKNYNNG